MAGSVALAQNPQNPAPKPDGSPAAITPAPAVEKKSNPARPAPKFGDSVDFAKKLFDRLTPEEKARFMENFERWKALPPEERQALMMHEKMQREKIVHEIDEAIKKTGLQLDKDRREVFALRYTQERRKIEDQLRKEMEEKRRPLLQEMLGHLVSEFNTPPLSPATSPAPTPAPTQ